MIWVQRAQQEAEQAHAGQVDKAGLPYIDHPRRVAVRVAETSDTPEAIVVAWLHDVIEDTGMTLAGLRQLGFSAEVVAAVDALTRRPGEGDNYYHRVAADDLATVVKLADIWDNSNPERLALLEPPDRDRLIAKYRHALHVVSQVRSTPGK